MCYTLYIYTNRYKEVEYSKPMHDIISACLLVSPNLNLKTNHDHPLHLSLMKNQEF